MRSLTTAAGPAAISTAVPVSGSEGGELPGVGDHAHGRDRVRSIDIMLSTNRGGRWPADVLTPADLSSHQARSLEHLQVFGHGVQRDREVLRDIRYPVRDSCRAGRESRSRRIGDDTEHAIGTSVTSFTDPAGNTIGSDCWGRHARVDAPVGTNGGCHGAGPFSSCKPEVMIESSRPRLSTANASETVAVSNKASRFED